MRLEEVIQKSKAESAEAKAVKLSKKIKKDSLQLLLSTLQGYPEIFEYYTYTKLSDKNSVFGERSKMKKYIKECEYLGVDQIKVIKLVISEWRIIVKYLTELFHMHLYLNPEMFLFSDFYRFRYYIYNLLDANDFSNVERHTPMCVFEHYCNERTPTEILGGKTKYSYVRWYDTKSYEVEKVPSKKLTNVRVVFPWDDTNFSGDFDTKNTVYNMLKSKGFPLHLYTEEQEDLIKPVKHVISALEDERSILIISNSAKFLTRLAPLVGITYALTNRMSSFMIDHNMLEEKIFGKRDSEEIMNQIRRSNLLIFNNLECYNRKVLDYRGVLSSILKRRSQFENTKTVFTMFTHLDVTQKALAGLLNQLRYDLGGYIVDLIVEESLMLDMTTAKSKARLEVPKR